jgi:hypothetical protein
LGMRTTPVGHMKAANNDPAGYPLLMKPVCVEGFHAWRVALRP